MSNTNNLEGLQCPSCKQADSLKIECLIVCTMTDMGTEEIGEADFTDESWACCPQCEFEGEVKDFRLYRVFNATDGIYASEEEMSAKEADQFVQDFLDRFNRQGYYLTAAGERIPIDDVRLRVEEAGEERMRHLCERTYRSAKVCIDDPDGGYIVPPTEAWIVANDRWNGWVMPYFAKAEADRVMAAWNASTEGLDPMRYDAAEDRYCVPFGPEVEIYQGEDMEIEGETRRLYGLGACAWTWDLEPKEDER